MGRRLTRPKINLLFGAKAPKGASSTYDLSGVRVRIAVGDDRSNAEFIFKNLKQIVGRELSPLVIDLLEIASIIFVADQYFPGNRNQFREIEALIPVRQPKIWKKAAWKLQETIAFLTQDSYEFHFVKRKTESMTNKISGKPSEPISGSCIALLSGGLDSFSGAKELLKKGETPIFVSHYARGGSHAAQKKVVQCLQSKFKQQISYCRVLVGKRNTEKSVMRLKSSSGRLAVQFSRSFLFLSLATALAIELGVKRVFMFENGSIAVNVAISESRINTKTAHPRFLQLYGDLIRLLFGVDLDIQNPYLYKTKSEVVENLLSDDFRSSIKIATSCWQTARVQQRAVEKGLPKGVFKGHHCGVCYPCILRRVSLASLHLQPKYDDDYLTDIFKEYPAFPRGSLEETITTIGDLLRFSHDMKTLSDNQLFARYPDLSIDAYGVDLEKVVNTYRRHADQIIECFNTLSNARIRQKFSSLLV